MIICPAIPPLKSRSIKDKDFSTGSSSARDCRDSAPSCIKSDSINYVLDMVITL